jgi:predicted DNA-binding transcriptional regulator AlpA
MGTPQCAGAQEAPTLVVEVADKHLAERIALFKYQPDEAWVDLKVVCVVRDRSPSSTFRDVKAGRLAPPIKIGPNAVRWRVGDVRQSLKGGAS